MPAFIRLVPIDNFFVQRDHDPFPRLKKASDDYWTVAGGSYFSQLVSLFILNSVIIWSPHETYFIHKGHLSQDFLVLEN